MKLDRKYTSFTCPVFLSHAVRTCPSITSDTFCHLMPARPKASLIQMVPKSWAGRIDNPSQKDPSKRIARTHSLS